MLQIDLFGKILGRSIAAINVCEPTDMGGIVVALSGNLMMEINFRRGGNERETEIDSRTVLRPALPHNHLKC